MNITIATAQYNKALELKDAGQDFEAARAFLAAQKFAMHCRSNKRHDLAFSAHVAASLSASRVIEKSNDQKQRSEAGRIKAESFLLFSN